MSTGFSKLVTEKLGKTDHGRQLFRLHEPLSFHLRNDSAWNVMIIVPVGFDTDFASVPWGLRWLVPPEGLWDEASVVHDFLCKKRLVSRFLADAIFREGMACLGVPLWRRLSMYYGVRLYAVLSGKWR